MTPAIPHGTGDGRTVPGPDSQVASGDRRGEDSPFDPGACGMSGHLMLWSGGAGEIPRAVGKPRARRRPTRGAGTLERGGDSLEGRSP
jgi:hypothetical protein